jgi:hypothetical protein
MKTKGSPPRNWQKHAAWQCMECKEWSIYTDGPERSRCCGSPVEYLGIWDGYQHVTPEMGERAIRFGRGTSQENSSG